MVIRGLWFRCDDGITRPAVVVYMQAADGTIQDDRFLIDSGADRTVLSADLLTRLALPVASRSELAGVGGNQDCVLLQTALELKHDNGTAVVRGEFAAFTDPTATDMSVLGRDVINNFDLVLSRRRNEVLLLAPPHNYRVESN